MSRQQLLSFKNPDIIISITKLLLNTILFPSQLLTRNSDDNNLKCLSKQNITLSIPLRFTGISRNLPFQNKHKNHETITFLHNNL